MKAIMISIQPQWVEKILNGEKAIEIRKTMPKCELPCKVYVYCTKGKNKLKRIPCHYVGHPNKETSTYKIINLSYNTNEIVNGKVVAEFMLKKVDKFSVFENGSVQNWNCFDLEKSCLTYDEIADYIGYGKTGYAWHIDNLKVYDKPKELSEFSTTLHRMKGKEFRYTSHLLQRPPQSWFYVEEV